MSKLGCTEIGTHEAWLHVRFRYQPQGERRCHQYDPDGFRCHRKIGHVGPHVHMQTTEVECGRWFCGEVMKPFANILAMRAFRGQNVTTEIIG